LLRITLIPVMPNLGRLYELGFDPGADELEIDRSAACAASDSRSG
jgi:hypothetical protein